MPPSDFVLKKNLKIRRALITHLQVHVEISTTRSCGDTGRNIENLICDKHRVCDLSIMHSWNKLGHVPICLDVLYKIETHRYFEFQVF